ncbi:hypothetical protein ACFQ88_04475 [Paenibacillus sp. NPDC056579]|uniref:hypothetical protein n=1 Tax=unclassified Paenibacillus TaxID=185978 RepID=UPI001EF75769|nr:hypothetical protein [Paenibacillus sp. H1-7]ULL16252.1 hypothetical protein DVH26_18440 [Paenibacillus sp. H1-7]
MNKLNMQLGIMAMCAVFMLPAAAGAAAATDSGAKATSEPSKTTPAVISGSVGQTNVNGVVVPGYYVTNPDSRVAYIPGGVGLVVVNKGTALPPGAYYVTK